MMEITQQDDKMEEITKNLTEINGDQEHRYKTKKNKQKMPVCGWGGCGSIAHLVTI